MLKRIALTVGLVVTALASAGHASALTARFLMHVPRRHVSRASAEVPPPYTSQTAITAAMAAAERFWGRTPACGQPTIAPAALRDDVEGMASLSTCSFVIDQSLIKDAPSDPSTFGTLCPVVAHEWGHLLFGINYFASTDPSDPAHSSDNGNIMALGSQVTTGPCIAALDHGFQTDSGYEYVRAWVGHGWTHLDMRSRRGTPLGSISWPGGLTDMVVP